MAALMATADIPDLPATPLLQGKMPATMPQPMYAAVWPRPMVAEQMHVSSVLALPISTSIAQHGSSSALVSLIAGMRAKQKIKHKLCKGIYEQWRTETTKQTTTQHMKAPGVSASSRPTAQTKARTYSEHPSLSC